jgi:hypothetical protein
MNPFFQEAPISQIPALRLLQHSGFSYLSPELEAVELRPAYYTFLDAGHAHGDQEPFMNMIVGIVKEGFRPYFHALGLEFPENE